MQENTESTFVWRDHLSETNLQVRNSVLVLVHRTFRQISADYDMICLVRKQAAESETESSFSYLRICDSQRARNDMFVNIEIELKGRSILPKPLEFTFLVDTLIDTPPETFVERGSVPNEEYEGVCQQ